MIMKLTHAYIIAANRSHISRMPIHIYFAADADNHGGYILVSDLYAPQLSETFSIFEWIDTVYPDTTVTSNITAEELYDF